MKMTIDTDRKTVELNESVNINDLIQELQAMKIDIKEYSIIRGIFFESKPIKPNVVPLPYYPDPNRITVSY